MSLVKFNHYATNARFVASSVFDIRSSGRTLISFILLNACYLAYFWSLRESFSQNEDNHLGNQLPLNLNNNGSTVSHPCDFLAKEHFVNWSGSIATRIPVFYPQSDLDLKTLLARASHCNVKVRPAGTKHSIGGFVHDGTGVDDASISRPSVIVISLAEYSPPNDWNGVIRNTTVRMGAGRTFLDLMTLARPRGLLMKTQTAGFIFSLGGVLMNPSAHGSTIDSERLCSIVSGLRVMLANGTTLEITEESEVKKWRGSLGLLGIVTAIQVEMRKDTGLRMTTVESSLPTWTFEEFTRILKPSLLSNHAVEFFVNIFTDTIVGLEMNFQSSDTSLFDPSTTAKYYESYQTANPQLAKTGATTVTWASRLFGWIFDVVRETVPEGWGIPYWRSMLASTIALKVGVRDAYVGTATTIRDGYYVVPDETLKFNNLQTFIKCRPSTSDRLCLQDQFEAVSKAREVLLNESENFARLPMFVLEWRLVEIKNDTLVLEHLSPGTWISIEIVSLSTHKADYPTYSKLEKAWRSIGVESGVHHGKAFGFEDNKLYPTGFGGLDRIYSDDVRRRFKMLMNEYDPRGLFADGAALQMLQ